MVKTEGPEQIAKLSTPTLCLMARLITFLSPDAREH
jgi:hypothetical protein